MSFLWNSQFMIYQKKHGLNIKEHDILFENPYCPCFFIYMNICEFTQRAESPIVNSVGQRPANRNTVTELSPERAKSTGLRSVGT